MRSFIDKAAPRAQVLRVRSCVAGSDAERVLRAGDLLLAVNGRPVTSCSAVQRLVEAAGTDAGTAPVNYAYFRSRIRRPCRP